MKLKYAAMILFALMLPGNPLAQSPPIKVGLAHVFSGPMATFGEVSEQGVKLAIDDVNATGGLLGRKIELVKADTQAKPDAGLAAVEKLVKEDKVDVILGIVSSAVALKVTPEMDRLGTPLIITHAMADAVTGKICSPWVFRMTWSTDQCLKAGSILVRDEFASRKWITIGPDYGFGKEAWEKFQSFLGPDYQFGSPVYTPVATKEWKPFIDALNIDRSSAVMVSLWGNNLRDFIKQAHAEKFFEGREVLCVVGGGVDVLWPLGFLDSPVGVWYGTPYWPGANETDKNTEFVSRYKALSSSQVPPSYTAYLAYAATRMYIEAVKKCRSVDKKSVIRALEGLEVDLPGGLTTFRPEDHQAMFPIVFGKSSDKVSRYGKKFRRMLPLKIVPGLQVAPEVQSTGCTMKIVN
jgi:branched-chain amino acid transport system substrate-binding protein